MTVPIKERYFEDYPAGEVLEVGDHLVTREEIVAFASRYDPQPFHLDDDAARESIYGGLIASGWMTCSVVMRMLVDHVISPISSMGSPGIDELRWLRPVRPGDRLRARVTVLETRRSSSRPDRGIIRLQQEALNQHDEVVLSMRGMGMYRCRPS
jgi:acyl dehydratase